MDSIQPYGRFGYQTFIDICERLGLQEFLVGNKTHQPLEIRAARLRVAYKQQAFLSCRVLERELFRSGTALAFHRSFQDPVLQGINSPGDALVLDPACKEFFRAD
jgi:hypothetical protein